jgi:hypothetical protein
MFKYLGKGASACAVRPPFSCLAGSGIDNRNPVKSYISKIYYSEDDMTLATDTSAAQQEYDSGLLLQSLDPEHSFTVAVGGWCTPSLDEAAKTELRTTCDLEPENVLRNQIFYEYGGISFKEVAKTNLGSALKALTSILRGLVIMGQAMPPLIHGDIHGNNIVIGTDGVARLIDYGEVCTPTTLWKRPELLKYDFSSFPPERYIAVREFTGHFPEGISVSPRIEILEDLGLSVDYLLFQFEDMCKTFLEETTPFLDGIELTEDKHFFVLDVLANTFGNTYDLFGLAMTVASACVINQKQWECFRPDIQTGVRAWVGNAGRYDAYTRFRAKEALELWTKIWEV